MTGKIDTVKSASHVLVLITIIGSLFSGVWMLDNYYQKQAVADKQAAESAKALLITELNIRVKILDTDIKKDAEVQHHYKSKALLAPLDKVDQERLEYLGDQLGQKYQEQRDNTQRLNYLKDAK